jgi:CheY-like chemotaxis protein
VARDAILVIDDDADVIESLVMVLSDEGFEVLSAQTGDAALLLAAEQVPAVALVDYHMPGIEAGALIGLLHERAPEMSIVLCTADDSAATQAAAAAAARIDHVLRKPFAIEELVRVVRSFGAAYKRAG